VTASPNLDLVHSIFAAWERGDFSTAHWAHSEIEFVIADGPEPGSWTELRGLNEAHRHFLSVWEDYHMKADDFRELDDERVLVLVHSSGRGKKSGLDLGLMGSHGAAVFHLRGGKVTRIVTYFKRERALADLGLAREGGSS
jgi:ketosteroid isomerase-like protein